MVDAYRKKKHGGIEKKRQSGSIWLDSICNWTVPHLRFSFEGHLERNPEYEDIEGEETVKFRKSDGIFLLENFHNIFFEISGLCSFNFKLAGLKDICSYVFFSWFFMNFRGWVILWRVTRFRARGKKVRCVAARPVRLPRDCRPIMNYSSHTVFPDSEWQKLKRGLETRQI